MHFFMKSIAPTFLRIAVRTISVRISQCIRDALHVNDILSHAAAECRDHNHAYIAGGHVNLNHQKNFVCIREGDMKDREPRCIKQRTDEWRD